MDLTVWGRLSSSNVQKVIWTLEELELPYRRIDKGGPYKGLDDPDYLAMNPMGLVPTLKDGSLVIWESHAIVRYLAATYASGLLWPIEPSERALADQWTDWVATTLSVALSALFTQAVRLPKPQRDPAALDKALAQFVKLFRIMDRQLARTPYLAGKGLTYADIVAGVSLYRWSTMEIDRPALPHVDAWHERLLGRAAFKKAVYVSYEELRERASF